MLISPYYTTVAAAQAPEPAFYQKGSFQGALIILGLVTILTGVLTSKVAYEGLGRVFGLLGVLGTMGGLILFLATKVL